MIFAPMVLESQHYVYGNCQTKFSSSMPKSQNCDRRELKWKLMRAKSGVAPANQTKERSVHELFAGAFRNRSSMWIVLVFLRKNTRIHKNGQNSWTFRFGLFFGFVCRGHSWQKVVFRKILVSVKFVSTILGPQIAAPILWAPRISVFFLQENLHVHKIPRFGGGGILGLGGGVPILFCGRGDFFEFVVEASNGQWQLLYTWPVQGTQEQCSPPPFLDPDFSKYCPRQNYYLTHSGKGGSSNFSHVFLLQSIPFRLIPVSCPTRTWRKAKTENY